MKTRVRLSRRSFGLGLASMYGLSPSAFAQNRIKTVVVAGATGRTGRRIVSALLNDGYQVRGLSRDTERARTRFSDSVEWMSCDVRNPVDVARALSGMDAVICAIGYTEFAGPNGGQFVDYLGVRHLVDTAKAQDAKHFVLISSGSAGPARAQKRNPLFGYVGFWKTKAENRLKHSGVPFTIIGPAGLIDTAGGTKAIRAAKRPEYITLPMSERIIDIGDVATIAVASLSDPILSGKSFALLNDSGPASYDWRQDIAGLPPEDD